MSKKLDDKKEQAEVGGVLELLLNAELSKGEVTTACAGIIWKEQFNVRKDAVERATEIIRSYRGDIPLAVLAKGILVNDNFGS